MSVINKIQDNYSIKNIDHYVFDPINYAYTNGSIIFSDDITPIKFKGTSQLTTSTNAITLFSDSVYNLPRLVHIITRLNDYWIFYPYCTVNGVTSVNNNVQHNFTTNKKIIIQNGILFN